MKSLTITTLFLSFAIFAFAQTNNQIQDSNNLRVKINSNGALFTDFEEGRFSPKPYDDITLNLLESLGFWIMGVDDNGILRGAIQKQNEGGTADWFPGHFRPNSDTTYLYTPELNKVYTVYASDIYEHIADFEDNGIIDNPNSNIYGWPAAGNPQFANQHGFQLPHAIQGLSGFWDANQDGFFDPEDGDFPMLDIRGCEPEPTIPTVMSTFYINDVLGDHTASNTANMNQLIEVTVCQFAYEEESALNNTVFVRYRVINNHRETLMAKMGINVDFTIGDSSDDYFGSNEARSIAFAYNSDNEDSLFGDNPPVMAVDMLRGFRGINSTFDSVLTVPTERIFSLNYENANQSPIVGSDYYNLMNGFFPNGASVSANDFQYGDLPSSGGINSEPSMGNAPGTRSALMISEDFIYQPQANNDVFLALTYTDGGSVAENLDKMIADNDEIQAFFDNCLTTNFTQTTATKEQLIANSNISIYPNPTSSLVNIVTAEVLQEEVLLYDITGKLLQRIATLSTHTQINVESLAKGSYIIKVKTEDGIAARHLVVQ